MSPPQINRRKLYYIGNLSIFMIGLGFAVRANIAPDLQADIYHHIDLANSAAMVGEALGATFTGFALTLLFGSALVDLVGMRRMLLLSALGYVAGALGLLAATMVPPGALAETLVLASLLLTGLGWGAVEAASNPMVAGRHYDRRFAGPCHRRLRLTLAGQCPGIADSGDHHGRYGLGRSLSRH